MNLYILKNHRVVQAKNIAAWAQWFENIDNRIIELTVDKRKKITVSTVFIGIGDTELFETKVWVKGEGVNTFRASTWAKAKRLHTAVCRTYKAERV